MSILDPIAKDPEEEAEDGVEMMNTAHKLRSSLFVFILIVTFSGPLFGFCAIFQFIREDVDASATLTAAIGVTPIALSAMLTPLCIYLCTRFTHRWVMVVGVVVSSVGYLMTSFVDDPYWMVVTYSIPVGVGGCMVMMGGTLLVDRLYTEHRNLLANIITSMATALGILIFPPIFEEFQRLITYNQLYRGVAVIQVVVGLPLSWFLCNPIPNPFHYRRADSSPVKAFTQQMMMLVQIKDPLVIVWMVGCSLWYSMAYFPYMHMVSIADNLASLSVDKVTLIISVIGMGEVLSRVLVGVCSVVLPWPHFYLYTLWCFLSAVWNFIAPRLIDFPGLVMYSMCAGMSNGFLTAGLYRSTKDLFGYPAYESVYSYTMLVAGVSCLIGPILAGAVFDATSSYDTVFYLGCGTAMVTGVLFIVMTTVHRGRPGILEEYTLQSFRRKSSLSTLLSGVSSWAPSLVPSRNTSRVPSRRASDVGLGTCTSSNTLNVGADHVTSAVTRRQSVDVVLPRGLSDVPDRRRLSNIRFAQQPMIHAIDEMDGGGQCRIFLGKDLTPISDRTPVLEAYV